MKLVKFIEVYRISIYFDNDKAIMVDILDPEKDLKLVAEAGIMNISARDGREINVNMDKVFYTSSIKFKEAVEEDGTPKAPVKVSVVPGDDPENLI